MTRNAQSLRHRRRTLATGAGLAVLALGLAACGGDGGGNGGGEGADGDASAYPIDCSAYDEFGDLSGKTVSVYASITDVEGDAQQRSYEAFEKCTGITIDYEGSREFEAQLLVRLKAGTPPDLAYLPQPGLLNTVVNDYPDLIKPAPAQTEANVDQYFSESWKSYGTVDGTFYAAPLGANVKSFVWYSPQDFKDKGYTVPETWSDLLALTAQMQETAGGPVWCAGVESGDATGWPGTDWIEDMMLRTAGPDVYDQWWKHEIPFNDPQVVAAFDEAGKILKNPDYVNAGLGGIDSIASTPWTDAGFGLLDGTCELHRAANFYAANWPSGTTVGEDGDVFAFYLPTDQTDIKPVAVGGEFVAAFADRPEVQAFQTFLASADWANSKAVATPDGGWVSANTGLKPELLKSELDQESAKILADPKAVARFDASDLMPGPVGAGTFWTGMVNWFTGQSTQDVVDAIEASWPSS
ncbi:carbohydrate ABC transporter substrate-binding protein [Xylanimonas allomyrinae]|uniref:Carbohydrate ABC transporter substrate-binding protein n=1 Tax=Xylanimonas allomyrinae TaxID=2509459 RepID=A0A4P6EN30_9MICO|nr:ABC transporter substrate-binding protein [Xylanimonas allomyrinae]QAY63875.1 carbohydrate ABC transporter substrate-binding protein [Xylanimonas allomyrinae]